MTTETARLYEFTVRHAWVPRDPQIQKLMFPEVKITASTPAAAAIGAIEARTGVAFNWDNVDTTQEELDETMAEEDGTWCDVFYGNIIIEGKGEYQLAAFSDEYSATLEDNEDDDDE